MKFILNNKQINTTLPAGTLLLDFVRYQQHLMGTKIGCREGDCGACTVLVGELINDELVYRSATSCLMPIGNASGKHIVTIEGVNVEGLNFIQQAFAEEGATQCGFCTPGFIVSLAGFCLNNASEKQSGIDAVNGNICRCTGYKSIERAIAKIEGKLEKRNGQDAISFAIENNILPAWFSTIKSRLIEVALPANGQVHSNQQQSKFLGGGTDLYVQQHETMVNAEIEFLFNKSSLNGIMQQGNKCIMGASATVSDMLESAIFTTNFPSLHKYIKLISSTQIRNMATVAGNFVNASPIGDLTIFFLALDAQLILSDGDKKRTLPLRKLYKGYKDLDKQPTEFIEQICFEIPAKTDLFNFEKVSKRTNLDIASVNTAIHISMSGDVVANAGISAGGVGPVPAYLSATSEFLKGRKITTELVTELIALAQTEISPISDARGTETYKRLLLAQLIKAHFITLFPALPVKTLLHTT
ncbi:MAG: FAD binding domain-containing protein [Ferruginibacter sp.]